MILKIGYIRNCSSGADDTPDRWIYIDNIREISVPSHALECSMQELVLSAKRNNAKVCVPRTWEDAFHPDMDNSDCPRDGDTVRYMEVVVERSVEGVLEKEIFILAENIAYLCNDKGDTVSKLDTVRRQNTDGYSGGVQATRQFLDSVG